MIRFLGLKFLEVLKAVAPLVGAVCILQILVVNAPAALFLQFLAGSVLAMIGMMLLFIGIDLGILPMGRFVGAELPLKGSLWLIAAVAFAMGFATTVAEPDVVVLSRQVETASRGAVRGQALAYVIAAGVGLLSALALLRIVWGFSMTHLLTLLFATIIVLSIVAPETATEQVDTILHAIVEAGELNDTGRGIAFVLPVDAVVGVARFMQRVPKQE